MNNKNYLFLIISFFLGFLISLFYNQKFNKNFFLSFFLITVLFYIIFYFLGSNESKENFDNFYNIDFFRTKYYNKLEDEDLDKIVEEEENVLCTKKEVLSCIPKPPKPIINITNNIKNIVEEEEGKFILNNSTMTYEENPSEEEEQINFNKKKIIAKKLLRNKIEQKPDISKYSMETPIPNADNLAMGYGPLNINISYNSQNSVNELDNIKGKDEVNKVNTKKNQAINNDNNKNNYTQPCVNQPCDTKPTNNLCNQGRIYNNSDWIYGTNAWTNDPDYYIPSQGCNAKYGDNNCPIQKIPLALNELVTTRKYRDANSVAPLMVNQPWSEFKSGDDLDSLK
jgi:hypothetical protein